MIKTKHLRYASGSIRNLLLTAAFLVSALQTNAQAIYALSNGNLIGFNVSSPSLIVQNIAITGIAAGQSVVGMDFRPQTGQLYALGYNSSNGEAQLYIINRNTAVATVVNATPIVLALGNGKVGFDFNPTVDRIRVTGSNNANLRLVPTTGAIAATDLSLAYAAGDPNAASDPSIGTVAYTNSYIAATSTTLYDYDDSLNVFATQIPPNNGTLNTIGSSSISVDLTDPSSDLDIFFNPSTLTNQAFFAANTSGNVNDNLYSVNLTTGVATLIGSIGLPVQDIACYISRSVPSQITGELVYAITAGNMLIGFDSNLPSIIRMAYPITGVTVGQTLVGFDSRPNTGQLYALGYNSTTNESQLYTINRNTGAATVVNASPVILALGTGKVSFDFNPTVDRIRVTSSNNANYRLVPTTGAIAATDLNQNYAAGDPNAGTDPSVGTVAYTNSYIASTSTILYVYDDSLNILATQIPPNNGTLNTIGSSGISVNLADPSSDMDIAFNTNSLTNIAFISANTGASANDGFYTMNLSTGAASLVGGIGYGIAVRDISVFINRTIPSTYTGELVYAHTSSNFLVGFDSDVPTIIRAAVPVTGLTVGQSLVGMDFRPANKLLYGLGYNSTNGESQLYTINRQTGVATVVNSTPVVLALGTGDIGFDFNPTVDRIRVVGANNANYRLIPTTGAIAATDANLAYAGSDINFGVDPTIGAIAYTNSFSGSTTTTLYDYDNSLNILATQIPPNNGTLNTVGSSGIVLNGADATADMDIYYDMSSSSNSAYLSANTGSSNFDDFYSLNLATGAANIIGKIGFGVAVRDIALFPIAVNMMRTNTEERMASNSIYEPENNIRLFPNPVNEATRISFSAIDGENIKINVSDISGRELKVITQQTYNGGNHQISWNATDLKAGIYFLNLYTDNNKSQTIKFLVR